MSDHDETAEAVTVPPRGIQDAATVAPSRQNHAAGGDPADSENRSAAAGFASLAAFSRDLVDIGLIEQTELEGFAADSADGVVGISRASSRPASSLPIRPRRCTRKKAAGS